MRVITVFSELIDEPQGFVEASGGRKARQAGLTGYFFGALSLFVFLRMFSAVPPGGFSFLNVLSALIAVNFMIAAVMHLFLEMTGAGGSAMRLFFLLGATEPVWGALIPLGFLAKAGFLPPAAALSLCLAALLAARMYLLGRLYSISMNKALLTLGLPYAALAAAVFMAFVYGTFYLLWLVL